MRRGRTWRRESRGSYRGVESARLGEKDGQMNLCKGCGAEILWLRTKDKKVMPCNPKALRVLIPTGETVLSNSELLPVYQVMSGYASHFATCPKADELRRTRRKP